MYDHKKSLFSNLSDVVKKKNLYLLIVSYLRFTKNLSITDGNHAEGTTYVAVAGEQPTEVTRRNPYNSLFWTKAIELFLLAFLVFIFLFSFSDLIYP